MTSRVLSVVLAAVAAGSALAMTASPAAATTYYSPDKAAQLREWLSRYYGRKGNGKYNGGDGDDDDDDVDSDDEGGMGGVGSGGNDMPKAPIAPAMQTIAEIVAGKEEFSVLLAALKAADLVDAVSDASASLTVFAPTNAAFVNLAKALGYEGHAVDGVFAFLVEALTGLGDGDPIPLLTSILKYHVVGSAVSSTDLVSAGFFIPLEGPAVVLAEDGVTLFDFAPGVADPKLVADMLDIETSNGRVHVIDGVLLPVPVLTSGEAPSTPMATESPMPTKAPKEHSGGYYYRPRH